MPRLLDLFCGQGGAAAGYDQAGFEVVGVDCEPQPRYPFEFIQGDWEEALAELDLASFDLIHASPPCQAYSITANQNPYASDAPDLVKPVRAALRAAQRPYVIENVPGAPLVLPALVCGSSFPQLNVRRHRLFECSFPCQSTVCRHELQDAPVNVSGGLDVSMREASDAMGGLHWMSREGLTQAIPPPYAFYVAQEFFRHAGV